MCPNCKLKGGVKKIVDGKFSIYFCSNCQNGFTIPVPKNSEDYYSESYWKQLGMTGKIKDIIFRVFQKRRTNWIMRMLKEGDVLDVGSGEGKFSELLPKSFKVVNIEPPDSKVKNKSVIKQNFLKWRTKKKFDCVCFWESLEHTPYPQRNLEKAYWLLNKNGKIFIEFPRYNSLESRIFSKFWFHLDLPRHLSHLTDKGIVILLRRAGFKNIKVSGIPAFEYAPWGFTVSLFKNYKRPDNFFILILLLPFTLISTIIEVIFLLIGESPIGLATAEK